MILEKKISANEKYEVLSTLSPNSILVASGFLGGLILALLLSPLVILLIILATDGGRMREAVIGLMMILSLIGAIASKFLQWEYNINREAYKRGGEFHIPLIYPFFFLCTMGIAGVLWFKSASKVPNATVWVVVLILALGSAILSSAWGVTWRFWHILCLSIISPVDWRVVIAVRNFNHQLKMSFAEVKRYPSPLSLTVMDINQYAQIKGRVMKRIQKELMNIIDKNVREADVVGRIEGGKVVVTMAHTGSSGAAVQAKRVKKILEEHLKALEVKGERATLSIGIASYTSDMTSYKDLIKRAQIALRRAKEEGGDQLSIE